MRAPRMTPRLGDIHWGAMIQIPIIVKAMPSSLNGIVSGIPSLPWPGVVPDRIRSGSAISMTPRMQMTDDQILHMYKDKERTTAGSLDPGEFLAEP
jgi:hypothetical protein